MAAVRDSSFMSCSEGNVEGYREIDVVKEHIRLSAVSWLFYSYPIWVYCVFECTLLQQGSKAQNKVTKEIKRNTETSAQIEFTSQGRTREPLSMFPPMPQFPIMWHMFSDAVWTPHFEFCPCTMPWTQTAV